eukprot:1459800-Rhodomonas_salina.1
MAEYLNQDASCKGLLFKTSNTCRLWIYCLASLQDLQCSKTCNVSCKGLIFKTCNASRPATLHAKGFSSRPPTPV